MDNNISIQFKIDQILVQFNSFEFQTKNALKINFRCLILWDPRIT